MECPLNKNAFYFGLLVACLLLFAYWLQTRLFLSGDVSYLAHLAQEVLTGKKYGKDFLETNPPMVLYLYMPACFLAKWTALPMDMAIRCYIFFLCVLSLLVCFALLKKVFSAEGQNAYFPVVGLMLVFVLFFLPVHQFGQREHLLMALLLPYLFSTVLLLQGRAIPRSMVLCIGLAAGTGLALKPFFLAPYILVEGGVVFFTRRAMAWLRTETFCIIAILVAYVFSVYYWQPDYFKVVLPLVFHFYFLGTKQSWAAIYANYIVVFCAFVVGMAALFYKKDGQREFTLVMALAIIGMVMAFVVPRAPWYYHMLPAFGFGAILLAYQTSRLARMAWGPVRQESGCMETRPTNGTGHAHAIGKTVWMWLVLALVFFVPIYDTYLMFAYDVHEGQAGARRKLAAFLTSLPPGQSVSCFSANTTYDCFPLVSLTHQRYVNRYPFFWWLRGLLKWEHTHVPLPKAIDRDKQYLLNSVAADLVKFQDNLVIINAWDAKYVLGEGFDFIRYFSQNAAFKQAWQGYRLYRIIDDYYIYARADSALPNEIALSKPGQGN